MRAAGGGRRPWLGWCCIALLAADPAQAASAEDDFREGMAQYELGYYGAAHEAFVRAAERGHVRAQEIAAIMSLAGPRLYGRAVPLDREAAKRWLTRAAEARSEAARHLACVSREDAPATRD